MAAALSDILANDPYFAASYASSRYDDFVRDGYGRYGGVPGPVPGSARAKHVAGSRLEGIGSVGWHLKTGPAATLASADVAIPPGSLIALGGRANATNCVVVTGDFAPATRYRLSIPMALPADPALAGASLSAWAAPLSFTGFSGTTPMFEIRGPKYGRVCEPPQQPAAGGSGATLATP
ncbi:uncharacterized protein AMSG_11571, partial [Thecamonas trahens ATCC 50062]